MYEFWLFIHVLMAIVWVGGNIHLQIIGARLVAANDAVQIGNFSKQAEWIGTRVLTPAAIVIVIAGVFMTLDAWDFEQLWIIIGLAGFLYSFINGARLPRPPVGQDRQAHRREGAGGSSSSNRHPTHLHLRAHRAGHSDSGRLGDDDEADPLGIRRPILAEPSGSHYGSGSRNQKY